MNYKIRLVLDIWKNWDYRFDLKSIGASIYLAWELSFATYFQETKIDSPNVRRCLSSNVVIENFYYSEIQKWSNEERPYREYC